MPSTASNRRRAGNRRSTGTPNAPRVDAEHRVFSEVAMSPATQGLLNHLRTTRAALLRAGCVALFAVVSGCGGGADSAAPLASMPAAALVVAAARSIDDGASGNPVSLRVVRSANGDGFAVWQADDGTRRNLWANRYDADTAAWERPVSIESSDRDIVSFELAVDATGNAMVVWGSPGSSQDPHVVMSVRFDAGAGAWAAPILVTEGSLDPRVSIDATGAALVVYGDTGARMFDSASGLWQPQPVVSSTEGTGFFHGPIAGLVDGNGNALVAFMYGRTGTDTIASNYYSRSGGGWGSLPPDHPDPDVYGLVPNSAVRVGYIDEVQLARSSQGNFVMAWQTQLDAGSEIWTAHFTSSTRTWSTAYRLVPIVGQNNVRLQRIGSDGAADAFVLWTESDGMRTALKTIRLDDAGAVCSAVQTIDRAIGGGAGPADLGVDESGNAIAIWQQFEGGNPDDGSRSNIAISRFDPATGAWTKAVFAETQPGNAISPRASASGGQALLGWIQSEGGVNRVKVVLQPLVDPPGR
ncbi:MAG TPA: hypothetical protein VF107_10225 [Burkholderiaceae bacterium]